uniref:Rab9 effector protein with kelch motifs n=2 Tax=Macrostomum lignano TaxID=282301 RepID=A0A1I8HKL8_9PLAT
MSKKGRIRPASPDSLTEQGEVLPDLPEETQQEIRERYKDTAQTVFQGLSTSAKYIGLSASKSYLQLGSSSRIQHYSSFGNLPVIASAAAVSKLNKRRPSDPESTAPADKSKVCVLIHKLIVMELNPILELNSLPKEGMWYVLSGIGDSPSMRVGHTATFVRQAGQVLIVGGANPDGTFAEHYRLCLSTLSWDRVDGPAQLGRYEHAAFQTESRPRRVFAFAGAGTDSNRSDVVYVDVRSDGTPGKWKALSPLLAGEPPSPRTYHAGEAACRGDHLYVFSGGLAGADAVPDSRVHRLDLAERRWETLEVADSASSVSESPPTPRQGHAVAVTDSALFVHGGMHRGEFYSSLHRFDLHNRVWSTVSSGDNNTGAPCARAGHGAVLWRQRLLVFGGLGRSGALNDLYSCDLETYQWSRIEVQGDALQPRLDFAHCLCDIEIRPDRDEDEQQPQQRQDSESAAGTPSAENSTVEGGAQDAGSGQRPTYLVTCLLINGGMDTEGNIFDDTLVYPLAIRCLVSDS